MSNFYRKDCKCQGYQANATVRKYVTRGMQGLNEGDVLYGEHNLICEHCRRPWLPYDPSPSLKVLQVLGIDPDSLIGEEKP